MSFDLWSFLKGFVPECFIKVDNSHTTHIHIGRDNVVVNGIDLDREKSEKIKEVIRIDNEGAIEKESYPYNLVHKKLFNSYIALEEAILDKKELVLLGQLLTSTEMSVILRARSIHKLMIGSCDKQKKANISELIEELDNKCPVEGRKVLNLMTAKYFETLIIPMALNVTESPLEKKKFRDFYLNILNFFPTAIFVNNDTSSKKIVFDLQKRLALPNIPYVIVHTMGESNIKKVDEALEEIKKAFNLEIIHEDFKSNFGISARNTKVILKNA